MINGHELPFNGSSSTGFAAEFSDGGVWTEDGELFGIRSNSRMYLVENWQADDWSGAGYVRLNLLNKTLRVNADVSKVPCGCAATLYLVAMGDPNGGPNYCDIQPNGGWQPCFEVDLMEANKMAYHASLHTQDGDIHDGTCNAKYGCTVNTGRYPYMRSGWRTSELYGPGAKAIDTDRTFQIIASFDSAGSMTISLAQGDVTVDLFNRSSAGNVKGHELPTFEPGEEIPTWAHAFKPHGVPDDAITKTSDAMQGGLVLTASVWNGDNTQWLDDFACGPSQCDISGAIVKFSSLEVVPYDHRSTTAKTSTATATSMSTTATTTTMTTTTTLPSQWSWWPFSFFAVGGAPQLARAPGGVPAGVSFLKSGPAAGGVLAAAAFSALVLLQVARLCGRLRGRRGSLRSSGGHHLLQAEADGAGWQGDPEPELAP